MEFKTSTQSFFVLSIELPNLEENLHFQLFYFLGLKQVLRNIFSLLFLRMLHHSTLLYRAKDIL